MAKSSSTYYRDALNKKISGVCAGFAKHHHLPIWLVRLAVIIVFLNAPIIMAALYLVCHLLFEEQILI
ncbi:PspC domain-containing protein [Pseudoalteromonas sp. T1lg76]|uniref:PspC domain-containing protein n=1 Tax=Pseudoalteromonas sp. T1lg76 TaxID=2077103 RepID=UPI000CF65D0A|nr:PspC domain-containing protein [Pseudoalteromonas sp. T1lg76]